MKCYKEHICDEQSSKEMSNVAAFLSFVSVLFMKNYTLLDSYLYYAYIYIIQVCSTISGVARGRHW